MQSCTDRKGSCFKILLFNVQKDMSNCCFVKERRSEKRVDVLLKLQEKIEGGSTNSTIVVIETGGHLRAICETKFLCL